MKTKTIELKKHNNENSPYHFFGHKGLIFISMLYVIITVLPTLFLYRLIQIGPLILPGGMFIFPFIYVIGDVTAEVYGYKIARLIIWCSLICNFIFAFAILSVLYLPYPTGYADISHNYINLFHNILRGDLANIVGVFAGRFLNAYLLTKWKVILVGRFFILRSFFSSAIGELIMLTLWITIAFGNKLTHSQLLHLAFSDYVVRISYALIFAWPASKIVSFLKVLDKTDVYDTNTKFNPFSLSIK